MNWDLSSRWKAPSSARSLEGCLYGLNFLLERHGIDSICPVATVRGQPADVYRSLPVPSRQGHQPEIQGGSMLSHGCSILSEQRRHSPYSIQFESRLGSAAKQKSRELVLRVHGYRSQYEVSPFPPLRGVWLRDGDIRHDFIHPRERPCADWERGSLCPSLPMACLMEDIAVFPYIFSSFFPLTFSRCFALTFAALCLHLMLNLFLLLTHSSLWLFVHLLLSFFCLLPARSPLLIFSL